MKRNGIWIIIFILFIALFWYYCDNQKKKFKMEKEIAISEAVENAIEFEKSRGVAKEPPVKTKIIYVEKETQKVDIPTKKDPTIFTDDRDGQSYHFVEIEGVLWMANNLNYDMEGSWCYEGNKDNCKNYGRLYTWSAAKGACPDGWRLPEDEDWNKLINAFGGIDMAADDLKVGGKSGFNALMAGYRDKKGFYGKVDSSAYFWSATEQNEHYASFRGIYHNTDNIGPYTYMKSDAFSVRCIKEAE